MKIRGLEKAMSESIIHFFRDMVYFLAEQYILHRTLWMTFNMLSLPTEDYQGWGSEGGVGRENCEDQEGGAPGQGSALSYNDSLTRWAGLEKYRLRALCSHLPEHALDVFWKSTPHTLPNVTSSKGLLERKVKGLLERKVNADIKKNSEVLIITRLLGQLGLCTSPSW